MISVAGISGQGKCESDVAPDVRGAGVDGEPASQVADVSETAAGVEARQTGLAGEVARLQ